MNNKSIGSLILLLVVLALAQGLIFKSFSMSIGGYRHFHILIYPLFIILMPFGTSRPLQLFLAFALGLFVDIFYESPGIHASAAVFTAYIRPLILNWLEPREGYNINHVPTKDQYGITWYLTYSGIMMMLHLFFYFSVDAFTYYYIVDILLRTLSSFVISMVFVIMAAYIFNSKPY
ncbi:MAG: hypothetical protein KDC85_16885 [Saprospiraceae bacterium]|nr:hypothetical protein [Saprospiraceae bacterium]MCB9325137.1 hypothetical protein [Lewinellaceae bacterium]